MENLLAWGWFSEVSGPTHSPKHSAVLKSLGMAHRPEQLDATTYNCALEARVDQDCRAFVICGVTKTGYPNIDPL